MDMNAIEFVHKLSKEIKELQGKFDIERLHKEACQRKLAKYEEMTGIDRAKLSV